MVTMAILVIEMFEMMMMMVDGGGIERQVH